MSNTDKNSSLSIYWMNDNSHIHKLISGECAIDGIDLFKHAPFLKIEGAQNGGQHVAGEIVLLWEENDTCNGVVLVQKADNESEEHNLTLLPFMVSISVMGQDCVQLSEAGRMYTLACCSRNATENAPDAIMLQVSNIPKPLIILQYSSIKTSFPKFALPIK